jgi:Protein of unknown function (DUF3108)
MRVKNVLALLFVIPALSFGQTSPYQAGEKIEYTINYGVIQGGVASLELKSDTFGGKEVLHTKLFGRTTGLADAIFRVKDIYESYFEAESGLPVFSIRNIQEGRYKKYNEVIFDHYSRSDSAILISDLTGIHLTQPGIHDILSCFYFLRNNHLPNYENLKPGDMITIMTWFTDELYPIRLRYLGLDEVRTKVGRIKCLKFDPVTETGRLFKTEEDMSIWFSADKNFLPVKIRFDLLVGAFTAEVEGYEGLKYPLGIRKKQ